MATPTPTGTGTTTPLVELDPEETKKSLKVSLADLCAKATALFAHKKYEEAVEIYGQAAEMQAEMNGEMNPANAEILFLYGRALFKVGQSKSDVLGGKAPEAKPAKPKASKSTNGSTSAAAEPKPAAAASGTTEKPEIKKPLFQFQGDENFEDSDEDEEAEGEGEEDEEDDDLATAFEVLDLARVLFNKQLEALKPQEEEQQGKGKEVAEPSSDSAWVRHIKERLADTHDLLAEISLENERYPNAITDSRASLKYKEELYPFESEIIAEAHFKLSLALEFASVTKSSDDEDTAKNNQVDQSLRDEAAAELEAAINSTKQKLQNKEVELATLHNPDDNEATRRQIADVKEVLADMEQRLVDLRKPPVDLNAALGIAPAPKPEVSEEVKKAANDLTGLVRKKRKADEGPAAAAADEPGKKAREGDVDAS
ncbi:hypothetical protein VTJ49DRAFT_3237 [Mycothermus thermophilus]|uniref:Tetratricopeptide SHNi-TPR domain-containing protein n=1 Tax=Humicola insolens TaxID=85995 RepID=A0ABR3V837_HUMIN